MKGQKIREALHQGKRIYSSAVVAASPNWPKVMAAAGVDFVFIDSEHTPLGREALAWMCRAFDAAGVPPVIRIPNHDPSEAAQVLDGGASGFIAPYIETAEQVRQLKAVARYRPLKGQRVEEAVADEGSLEPELRDYLSERNKDTLFILNIESVPAVENLDEILSVGGVDSVLIGPHDLSCSLGIPEQYEHPKFDEAVRTIFRKARSHNVGAGIHFWDSMQREVEWANAGGNLIMHSADQTLFAKQLKQDIQHLRKTMGDASRDNDAKPDVV